MHSFFLLKVKIYTTRYKKATLTSFVKVAFKFIWPIY